jgi:hypothetical protein
MFIIEKLVRYDVPIDTVFESLKQAWQEEGFEIVTVDEKGRELLCTAQSYRRVRVHIKTLCIREGSQTIVQMIYSPALTPVMSRPVSLKSYIQKAVKQDLETRMGQVLHQPGPWVKAERDQISQDEERLENPLSIRRKARKSTASIQMGIGLAVALIGSLMSYLHFNAIFMFGSYETWLTAALIGVIVFCIGIFNFIWGK